MRQRKDSLKAQKQGSDELKRIAEKYKDRLKPETIRQCLYYSEGDPRMFRIELEAAEKFGGEEK